MGLLVLMTGVALTAGQAPAPSAQQQQPAQPPAQQPPTFKVRVDFVEVDAVVTDREGRLVRDLKKEDFQVLEDGKSQTITNFTHVDIPVDKENRPLFAASPIEPPSTLNRLRATTARCSPRSRSCRTCAPTRSRSTAAST